MRVELLRKVFIANYRGTHAKDSFFMQFIIELLWKLLWLIAFHMVKI